MFKAKGEQMNKYSPADVRSKRHERQALGEQGASRAWVPLARVMPDEGNRKRLVGQECSWLLRVEGVEKATTRVFNGSCC